MANKYATQGRCLIIALKKRPHTYMEMLAHGVSTSPWRRIVEGLRHDEKLVKGQRWLGDQKLTTWRVVKA